MAEEIAAVRIKTWQSAYKGIVPDSFLNSMSVESKVKSYKFGSDLEPGHYFFAVKSGSKIIGFLYLCKYREADIEGMGEIGGIYLLPEFHSKGIGAQMMQFSIDFLKGKSYKQIGIWVLEQNEKAISFYKKFGFEIDGCRKEIDLGKILNVICCSMKI